jgi:hypothetical protein
MTASAGRLHFLTPELVPLLRFERRAGGREVALLGVIEAGEFAPALPFDHYCWRCWLPMCPQMGRAASPELARGVLRSKIEQWVEAAGLRGART